jgi:hypothetical protein
MEAQKIKTIEKGWGGDSIYFSARPKVINGVDEIKQEGKQISSDTHITVYRGYRNGSMVFEMAANSDITLTFFE